MSSLAISFLVVGIVMCGALLGTAIQSRYEAHCQNPDTKDIVKPAMALIGTLAALVLGLVVATAKSSYDEKNDQVRQMTAKVIALDNILREFGPNAAPLRKELRHGIGLVADRIWQEGAAAEKRPFQASVEVLAFMNTIARLPTQNDVQTTLQSRALQTIDDITKARLVLFTHSGSSIPVPFLIILTFWFFALFASFTLFSKTSPVALAVLLVSALSIGGAIFLLLELDSPFAGLMRISSSLLRDSLPPL